jgi:hypothetical protein
MSGLDIFAWIILIILVTCAVAVRPRAEILNGAWKFPEVVR